MPDEKTYLELAKIQVETHKVRQGLEWKMLLGLWAGMALVPWFFLEHSIPLHCCARAVLVIVYLAMLPISTFLAILPLHRAHRTDRLWLDYYRKMACSLPADEPEKPPWYYGFTCKWAWAQILVTALLIIGAISVLRMR